ncbi:MAG: phage major capsid protein [Clostridia bacterium]|nr:phage major capsid protein [Clostridia bacterium]
MVTLSSADNALKSLYLNVVSEQLNTKTNPLLNRIAQTESDVWGKEIIKLAPYGVNGGIGAGGETDNLPTSAENKYARFVLTLKNLYGTIELSDKAIRASQNNAGAFVNLLNAEMDGLIKASKFNFGRMLYGDGTGTLATIESVSGNVIIVDSVQYLMEGMMIDICTSLGVARSGYTSRRITSIDRTDLAVTVSGTAIDDDVVVATDILVVQGSYGKELTGLGAIFGSSATLYGITRQGNNWLTPYTDTMSTVSDVDIQTAIDHVESVSGGAIDFIVCSYGVRRAYQAYLRTSASNIDVLNLEGGYKAISYSGIPMVADRFCPSNTMYLLDTKEFNLHQLCDWRWLEGEEGRILKQKAGQPVYTATLVKYADMICNKPIGQAQLTSITEA